MYVPEDYSWPGFDQNRESSSLPGVSRPRVNGHVKQELRYIQPCRDFLHNRCMKGRQCKYSHDINNIRMLNTQQDGACIAFIFGVCELPLCRFKHDVGMVKALLLAELQQDESPPGIKKGVCLEFLKGACEKGSSCSFSHSLQEYYHYLCKRKSIASLSKKALPSTLKTVTCQRSSPDRSLPSHCKLPSAKRCERAYLLRSVIPTLLPGENERAEAVIAVLEAHPSLMSDLKPIYDTMSRSAVQ